MDKTLLENQLVALGLFPYRFQSVEKTEKTQTNTLNSINNDTSFQRVNFEFDYAKNENPRQNSVHNKTPEKYTSKKKNFSPQALLNNLINNQKKEKNGITDCLKLKIEIARGGNDLTSKITNMNKNINKQKCTNFPITKSYNPNLSQNNVEEKFEIKPEMINRKIQERKKISQNNNKSNSHNSSLGPNQSLNDSVGAIKTRSKSTHAKNNNSFNSTKNNQSVIKNHTKKTEQSFQGNPEKKEKNENHKLFALNYLKLKSSVVQNSKK